MKGELFNMTQAWDKEKSWVPDRNRTHDLPNTGRALYPLSYENSWRARSFNWVQMWQVSCILLGSALSKSLWVVISEYRWWILCSVIKCERWVDQHDTNMEQRKNLSSDKNRTHDLPNTGRVLYLLSCENSWRARSFDWVHKWQASCILLGSALSKSMWMVISE